MPVFNINQFTPTEQSHVTSVDLFSHIISRGRFPDSKKSWICKEATSPYLARLEVLAQEFFRLVIPYQPETRLACNEVTGVYYVMSEEIEGYRRLPAGEAQKFENGTYTGLGCVLLCALFLEEYDLKNGNIGLDSHNRVVKIDGDWCFASTQGVDKSAFELTSEGISALPYPDLFYPFHWLDFVQNRVRSIQSKIVHPTLTDSVAFRNEVHLTLMRLSSIPTFLIERLVDQYIPAGGELFVDFIQARVAKMMLIGATSEAFQHYLSTPEAKKQRQDFLIQMDSFEPSGEFYTPVVPALSFFQKLRNLPDMLLQETRAAFTKKRHPLATTLRRDPMDIMEPVEEHDRKLPSNRT